VPETTGLIGAARLARMKRDAVLVNVARGPIVVEEDLYKGLVAGTIAGAVIDVWWQYPTATEPQRRGSKFPFHTLDNVLMTPHSSGWTEQMMDRRWDMIVANLRALWRGEPLRNVVRAPLV
jgi:phosphoglycerate dehydrogenase-like enzyme